MGSIGMGGWSGRPAAVALSVPVVLTLQARWTVSGVPGRQKLLQACPDLSKPQRPLYMNEKDLFKSMTSKDLPAMRGARPLLSPAGQPHPHSARHPWQAR